jgi:hypothetical protein
VQALAVLAAGDGFVELAAPISLSVRFKPRTAIGAFDSIIRARFLDASVEEEIPPPPRRDSRCAEFPAHADEVIAWRAFAAMYESESGTFETCRGTLKMSAYWVPEMIGTHQNGANGRVEMWRGGIR